VTFIDISEGFLLITNIISEQHRGRRERENGEAEKEEKVIKEAERNTNKNKE